MKYCEGCGIELKDTMKFCPHCGKRCGNVPEITEKGGCIPEPMPPKKKFPKVYMVIIVIAIILAAAIFIFQRHISQREQTDTDAVVNYVEVNDTLTDLTASQDYAQLDTSEKAQQVLETLYKLEDEKKIKSDSIEYDEAAQLISYEYADGAYGGVVLEELAKGISGVGEDSYRTSYNYEEEIIGNWPAVPTFNSASYPYEEQNLSAIMMYGLGQDYEIYFELSKLEESGWNQEHLATTLDDDCTTSDFRTELSGHDLIIIQEHGYIYKDNPIIVLQETITLSNYLASNAGLAYTFEGALYLEDFQENRVAILKFDDGYHTCLLPEFFTHYYGEDQLSDAIVWLGCCNGYRNDTLVKAFADCGAKAVLACTETIKTTYSYLMQDAIVYMLLYGNTVEESLDYAKTVWGENDKIFVETYSDQIDNDPSEIRIYNGGEATLATLTDEAAASVAPYDYDNLVTDAYSNDYAYTGQIYNNETEKSEETEITCTFRIPQINLSGNVVERINAEVYSALYPVIENSVNEITEYGYPITSYEVLYYWAVNGDILSLVIRNSGYPDWGGTTEYMVYNVSLTSGEEVSTASLLQAAGFSEEEYYERAKQVLGSHFWADWDPSNENFANQSFVDFFNEQLKKTVSDDNIAQSYPYINEKGQLCIIAKEYSLAVADYYWTDLNMIEFDLSPYYSLEAENITRDINISEEEAYQIACDYWDYSEGDVSDETGFELYLVYDGLGKKSDGNQYYIFRLRWWVPESNHMSTVDILYINAETGECSQ